MDHTASTQKRKLRALVITMGGERQRFMEEQFAHPRIQEQFQQPAFTPGVPSRSLRNRFEFFRIVHEAGLIPDREWEALRSAMDDSIYNGERFFQCLEAIPVTTDRHGSQDDIKLHYSVELWRKAKTVNRGRAVLGCTLAHLIALKRFHDEHFDVLLEDNVRLPINECGLRIWKTIHASEKREIAEGGYCHLRYFGWLGSIANLEWIYRRKSRRYDRRQSSIPEYDEPTLMSFPTTLEIENDVEESDFIEEMTPVSEDQTDDTLSSRKPGGNPVWGSYAYWISREAYHDLLDILRKDVGALLWKSKRARFYSVKPIDKVLPRQIMKLYGQSAVQLATHPSFFRAPMLTSKIHTQWDPEFCKSTEYQLKQSGLCWDDLYLTEGERSVVQHHVELGEWLTLGDLQALVQLNMKATEWLVD